MAGPNKSALADVKDEIDSLASEFREMLQLRYELAELELRADARLLGRVTVVFAISAVMILSALPVLAVFFAELLTDWLGIGRAGWLLITGLGLLGTGGMAAWLAYRHFRRRFIGLEQTLEELREDGLWLGRKSEGGRTRVE